MRTFEDSASTPSVSERTVSPRRMCDRLAPPLAPPAAAMPASLRAGEPPAFSDLACALCDALCPTTLARRRISVRLPHRELGAVTCKGV